ALCPRRADASHRPPAVGGYVPSRGGADEPVIEGVRVREVPLPDVAVPLHVDEQPIAPRVASSLEPAAGGALPFGFAGQSGPRPRAVRLGVVPADVDDGVALAGGDVGTRSFGCPPVRPGHFGPPGRTRCPSEHVGP